MWAFDSQGDLIMFLEYIELLTNSVLLQAMHSLRLMVSNSAGKFRHKINETLTRKLRTVGRKF